MSQFSRLLDSLSGFEQRNMLYILLKIASKDFLSSEITTESNDEWWKSDASMVSAVAALIRLMLVDNELRKSHLVSWLTGPSGAGIGEGISIRRAAIACLFEDKVIIETVLEKSLKQFGDQLYIRHTPAMQQEGFNSSIICENQPLTIYSTCPGPAIISRIFPSNSTASVVHVHEIRSSPQCCLQPSGGIVAPGSISRHGGGGGTIKLG